MKILLMLIVFASSLIGAEPEKAVFVPIQSTFPPHFDFAAIQSLLDLGWEVKHQPVYCGEPPYAGVLFILHAPHPEIRKELEDAIRVAREAAFQKKRDEYNKTKPRVEK